MTETLKAILDNKGSSVHSVPPATTVIDAVRTMNKNHVGSLLVIENTKVVGIFTERDVLTRIVDAGRDPHKTAISDVMTSTIVTVDPAMKVTDAMALITEKRCRHLPVMEEGELKGMVSIGDLMRWVTRHQESHIQNLVNYITGKYPG